MSNKKQTAVKFIETELNNLGIYSITLREIIAQAKAMEQEQSVICKDCGEIILAEQINNHLFMKVKGGGLIHWNCGSLEL